MEPPFASILKRPQTVPSAGYSGRLRNKTAFPADIFP